jgi:hypothetical protein
MFTLFYYPPCAVRNNRHQLAKVNNGVNGSLAFVTSFSPEVTRLWRLRYRAVTSPSVAFSHNASERIDQVSTRLYPALADPGIHGRFEDNDPTFPLSRSLKKTLNVITPRIDSAHGPVLPCHFETFSPLWSPTSHIRPWSHSTDRPRDRTKQLTILGYSSRIQ